MSDTNEPKDNYVLHLAAVNRSNSVCTIEDIRNTSGALIVAKGTPITAEISKKIVMHKLLLPLESCVTLEQSITPEHLLDELNKLIEQQDNNQILQEESLKQLLYSCCHALNSYPLLIQKITVMEARFPRFYRKILGSTFIALIIAWQMELAETECQNIFIAAIMRDIGLLHIEPALVKKRGKLSPDEWRTLQGHVAIAKIFLDLVPDLPKVIGRAVLEHHERSDGSGYPHGKFAEKLCQQGQVLAMADTVTGIYEKQIMRKTYSLAAVTPILQINMRLYQRPIYRAIIATIHELSGPLRRIHKDDAIPKLCTSVTTRIQQLALWRRKIEALSIECINELAAEKTLVLRGVAEGIRQTIISSGLLSEENLEWLKSVSTDQNPDSYPEVEQQLLMVDELEWHCQQWHSKLATCIEAQDNADWQERHRELCEILWSETTERSAA